MDEEVSEENIKQLIDKIPEGLSPIERVLLCNYSTNQTLLSVLFKVPIKVRVLSQHTLDNIIVRWVQLVAEYSPGNVVTACLAESVIPIKSNPEGFINGITECRFGIGQLIQACKLRVNREIMGMFADENIIARNYTLFGDVNVLITEVFPRSAIKRAEERL